MNNPLKSYHFLCKSKEGLDQLLLSRLGPMVVVLAADHLKEHSKKMMSTLTIALTHSKEGEE